MTEDEIIALLVHPAFTRAVDRRVRINLKEASKVEHTKRGHLPATTLLGKGVVPHADAAKRAGIPESKLINYIADGHVLGDAQSVHEPDLINYLIAQERSRRKRQ